MMRRTPSPAPEHWMIRTTLALSLLLAAALALPARAASPCPPRDGQGWKVWQECNQACIANFGLRGDPSGDCEERCDSAVKGFDPNVVAACAVCRQKGGADEGACVEKLLADALKKPKKK